jgi:hypothetical protein
MWKRRWGFIGRLRSDAGYYIYYGNKSVTYGDDRGEFEFAFEDGLLFPQAHQKAGSPVKLTEMERTQIQDRIISGIRSEGNEVTLF